MGNRRPREDGTQTKEETLGCVTIRHGGRELMVEKMEYVSKELIWGGGAWVCLKPIPRTQGREGVDLPQKNRRETMSRPGASLLHKELLLGHRQ